jgi:hypothetical protein
VLAYGTNTTDVSCETDVQLNKSAHLGNRAREYSAKSALTNGKEQLRNWLQEQKAICTV